MDKNQITGFFLIALLLITYFYFFAPEQPIQDPVVDEPVTTETVEAEQPEVVEAAVIKDTTTIAVDDSTAYMEKLAAYGAFHRVVEGEEKLYSIENNEIKIAFSTKGGFVKQLELKNFLTYDKKPLILFDEETSSMKLIAKSRGREIDLNELYYTVTEENISAEDTTTITFTLDLGSGQKVVKSYQLPPKGYQLIHKMELVNMDDVVGDQNLVYAWDDKIKRLEEHIEGYHGERGKTTINYYTAGGDFEDLSPSSDDIEEVEVKQAINWFNMKQKFFSAALIAENGFAEGSFRTSFNPDDSVVIKDASAVVVIDVDQLKTGKGDFRYYFGPNNYQITKKVTEGFSSNVDMGWKLFAFINKFVIIPVFNFLENYIANYGIIIIILVLMIKLVLSPLSYKSYVSMAKTKVLKPELDELKAKYGSDMQKIQQEQMKLYQQVGVNPLSGCIPVLLQMPILLAMFNFFPNSVELRQESFLWANDLSTFDAVLTWHAQIPLISDFYGNHVSLFTLLMTVSTILYTWSNNQMTAVQGPMKNIGYMMPIMFMFVLNSYPAGLTFYYFVSNIVTFGQQSIIRRFVNEDKVRKILDQNRKKNKDKKKSKFALKIEEAMKASEEAKRKKK